MSFIKRLQRPTSLAAAALLFVATVAPVLVPQQAQAYALPPARSVKLSSSAIAATGVSYRVQFTTATTSNVQKIFVDFCQNSPIIGDTCTSPTGFTAAGGTLTTAGAETQAGITGFTFTTENAGRTLVLTNAAGGSIASGTVVSFEVTGVTNPSDLDNVTGGNQTGTFYGRILTYATSAETYAPTTIGTPIDAGGTALAINDQITVQAKVQERLTFCIYTSAASASCTGNTTTNPVVLGDANGVLSSTDPSISKTAKYNITTNASLGATIRAKGATLTSGSFDISPVGTVPGDATGANYAANTEQFGLCTYRDPAGGAATGLVATDQYDGDAASTTDTACAGTTEGQGAAVANGARFVYDTATADNNFASTYGASIATKTAGDFSTGVLAFLGGVSNTTEPGIYTTTLTFIATGVY